MDELQEEIYKLTLDIEDLLKYLHKEIKETRQFYEKHNKHHKKKQQQSRSKSILLQKLLKQYRNKSAQYKYIRIKKKNGY